MDVQNKKNSFYFVELCGTKWLYIFIENKMNKIWR